MLRMFNRSMLSVFNVSPRRELQQAPLQLRWPRAQTQAQPPGPGPLSSRAPQPPAAVRLFLTVGDEPAHWRATPGSLPMQRFCTRRERGRLVHQAPWWTSAQQRLRRGDTGGTALRSSSTLEDRGLGAARSGANQARQPGRRISFETRQPGAGNMRRTGEGGRLRMCSSELPLSAAR